jgi:hypothetical protein
MNLLSAIQTPEKFPRQPQLTPHYLFCIKEAENQVKKGFAG